VKIDNTATQDTILLIDSYVI